jgi:hypothetical protein
MEEQINLLDYTYSPETEITLPGTALIELMLFAKTIVTNEERQGLAFSYSKKTKEVKDKSKLVSIEEDLIDYPTAEAFFNQKPRLFTSILGAGAQDLLMKLQGLHLNNIKNNVAIPIKNEEDVKL